MTTRPLDDRCPGLLRPFAAADGAIVRVRIPGGRVRLSTLTELGRLAADHGAPFLQLTSRANLQLRGLPADLPADFVDAVAALGLLPSPTHERVRTIVASPWSRHADDVTALVGELDAALSAEPALARLPGRFLTVIDDGSGHLLDLPYDLGYRRLSPTDGRLLVAGQDAGQVRRSAAVAQIVRRALDFVAERESTPEPEITPAWNIAELDPTSPLLTGLTPAPPAAPTPAAGDQEGDLVVAVPLGLLGLDHLRALASITDEAVLTPWRRLVLSQTATNAVAARLALSASGLVLDPGTGWDRLTACIGAPYCRRTDLDTGALARRLVATIAPAGRAVHLSGCERRCGAQSVEHIELVSPVSFDDALAVVETQ